MGNVFLRIILKLEKGAVPDWKAEGWKVEGEERRVTRKECKRSREEFEDGGFMARKGLWNIARKDVCPGRNSHTHKTHTPRPPTTPRPQRYIPHNTTHNVTRRQREKERDRERQRETEKERKEDERGERR